jgi:hypothetical protein
MHRQLQLRADDLAESLFVSDLEMRRSRTLEKRLEAFRDFGRVIDRIDVLRRDAEELHAEANLLTTLDRHAAHIMRSAHYRIAEWFHLYSHVHWYVLPAPIDPLRHAIQC